MADPDPGPRPALATRRPRLWLELSVIVAVKLSLFFTAKHLWFSEPLARHMTVPQPQVEQQLLGTAAQPLPPVSPTRGASHDLTR
ncbi:cytochrome oxidase putative small subunit CydP [Chitinimonas sp. JJ19]|uniref:cytochrome oxidase putative small subunit CydP n=1 Tax=Chitinimonas sp. JJ19 TaxID=3109352 RepID=UPI003002E5F3